MTSPLLRAGFLLTLLVSASVRLAAAEPRPTQQQIDAVRQQHLQAVQKLDWAAADRLDKELKALEARAGTVSTTATLSPASSFFSAPAGSPAVPPAGSSSVFNPPTTSSATFAAPAFTPAPAAKSTPPAPKSPTPAAPALSTSAPKTNLVTPPAATFIAPGATTVVSTSAPARANISNFGLPAAAPLSAEEPRPAELPPVVLELRAAESALSKLEEFRMAESQTTRRGTTLPPDLSRSSLVPPPSAVMAPSTPSAFTPAPSVNLTGTSDDLRRKLDDLTRRRTELQLEAERLAKDNVDWEARYNAAKAELARLEAQNQDRNRLQSIRDEIARLDSDSTRLMQEAEASRADQDRRARTMLPPRTDTPSSLAPLMRDRPMVPTFGGQSSSAPATPAAATTPERKGGPTFQSVGSSKPQRMASDGNIVRTGRSGEDAVALQRDLDKLTEKREIIMRELDEVQLKFNLAQRELATAGRTGVQSDIDRWTKETAALDARYKAATAELSKVDAETQSKIVAMKGAVSGSSDPDTVNPGDSLRLIVAEDDTYNAIYPVKRDGNITVKGVGRVAVGGKHISEAEAAVKAVLEETQLTKATVTLEFVNKKEAPQEGGGPIPTETVVIYLAGEFITPGPLKIPEGVAPTLITTIIRSGGITPSGDLTRTKLLRIENGQGAVEEINVAAILSGNIPPTDIALNPGDIIMIPAFAPVVYVTGNVNKPGTLRLFQDETLTAYAAILRAGGFARFANLKKCTVVRDLGNGEKIQMPLNVKEIQKGLAPDIVLQGKDIVVVPESFFSF